MRICWSPSNYNNCNSSGHSDDGSRAPLLPKQEMSKFINHCNEVKAATAANKEGGQLSIVKPQSESSSGAKK
ncbi:hypothetical protein RHSIM_Rhsim01G0126100 [Rhododendron simsii]|uniref:Uncharacterized protein n=1 Tax=Rhododendron simsii TaxID=118357 RepID=A0A834HFU3_RHOSS|nr:hypothetical protein RHSIM_Rhsim01G0126100 [Rhododendron simsii]